MKKSRNEELLANSYDIVDRMLSLYTLPTINDKVQVLIMAADVVMGSICTKADSIAIDAYETLVSNYPNLGMPKPVWLELVHIRRLQRHTTMPEDLIQKITDSLAGANNVTALRQAVVNSINALDKEIDVPSMDTSKSLTFTTDLQLHDDFTELLNESADNRNEMDAVLWPKLKMYGEAFEYLTGDTYKSFKVLLDLYHYRKGGWPQPKTPPRIWSIIQKFTGTYDLLAKYDFDMATDWCKRFGLQVNRTTPSPTLFMFTENASSFGKHTMCKIAEEHTDKYLELGVRPWHHLLIANETCFAYVWDSRVIEVMFDANELDMQHTTANYSDSCQLLQTTDTTVHTANVLIPELLVKQTKSID